MALPSAISFGMTVEQYWDGDPWLYAAFRESQRQRDERGEWERWQMGLYVYNSISSLVPALNPFVKKAKPEPYPEEPYGITSSRTPEETAAHEEKAAHEKMALWLMGHGPA